MAQVFKNPLDQANSIAPETTRSKWNRYFKHIGDGNPRTIDKYNALIGEIESELPFANQKEHDKWLDLASVWKGESEWPNLTEKLLYRQENPIKDLSLDRAKFKSVYDKANTDFPNDWGNKVDYIRQELGLEWPETIADVYIKGNKLYGLQTQEKGEPYEVELYNLK